MGLFEKLFGSKEKTPSEVDVLWLSDSARMQGLRKDVGVLVEDRNSVLVVTPSMAVTERIVEALAQYHPERCMSSADAGALRAQFARAGAVTVAMSSALVASANSSSTVPLEVLVIGRSERRAVDEEIKRAAASLAATSHVTFHNSLDDALLLAHLGKLKPMLEKLGMNDAESIDHPFISRAIRNAQKE